MKQLYEINGNDFSTLEEFFALICRILFTETNYSGKTNLDALNDMFRGGFGTPENGFILRWVNSKLSRQRLGYSETVKQLEKRLTECHPRNVNHFTEQLDQARRQLGPTVFDWLIDIIEIHCPGGEEEEDGVELILD
jgi:RNAse (barnase) inhibitor barstar